MVKKIDHQAGKKMRVCNLNDRLYGPEQDDIGSDTQIRCLIDFLVLSKVNILKLDQNYVLRKTDKVILD